MNTTKRSAYRVGWWMGLLLFCLTSPLMAKATQLDFTMLIEEYQHLSEKDFLHNFPFDQYCTAYKDSLQQIRFLERHKEIVNAAGLPGDAFLVKLFQAQLERTPLDFSQITSLKPVLAAAETMYHSEQYLPDSVFV
ncbi:MAG: hypothetical protein AAGD05_17475, partial [Bacteroidota bacterium]